MIQRLLPRGIRQKLLASLSLLVLSIAIFVFVFFRVRLEEQAMGATVDNAVAARDMTAYSLSAGLFFADTSGVEEVLAGAARGRDIRYLAVRDKSGRLLATNGTATAITKSAVPESGYVTSDGDMYVTATPILHSGKAIGTLTVGVSLDALRGEVRAAVRLGAILSGLVLLVGFGVVYGISSRVTRPLRAVSETVRQIAAGNLTLRAEETADTEVKELVLAFNNLIDNLAGAQAELSQSNQQLEVRVDARTAELSQAVAEQRRAQIALTESEAQARATSEMLQSLIDVAPQAIVAVDRDWIVTRWNKTAERLLGWPAAEVLGQTLPCLPEADRVALSARHLTHHENGNGSGASEVALIRKTGSKVNVLLSIAAIHNQAHDAAGYICVATDLTDLKSLEEQLRQSQKMDAVGRLAGGVAHDFNNILTVITSSATMLLEKPREPEDREDMEAILTSSIRAAALTRQLLLFSSKQPVQLQSIDLTQVVNGMGPMLRRLLRANVHLATVLGPNGCCAVADPPQLEQVIMNLVVNASDAMPDGGTLTLRTDIVDLNTGFTHHHGDVPVGRYVVLTVSDTGTGIDPANIGKIFEPFFTTKDVGKGTGLGLATVYAVISQLGGHIRVQSEPRKGTVFKIYLPRETLPVGEAAKVASADTPLNGTATILVVEDESSVRSVMSRTLGRLGYSIIEAADGEGGLAVVRQRDTAIDLLITDVMMPGMNGHAFAEKALEERPGLRVLFVSGYTPSSLKEPDSPIWSHAFLQKPFRGPQLAQMVNDVLHGDGAKPDRRTLA
jgi:two-component system cell cycle sensor histidine kinase/response regulator CckA